MRLRTAHFRQLVPLLAGMAVWASGLPPAAAQEAEAPPTDAPEPAEDAETPPEEDVEPPRRRVAVLILATGGVDPAMADGLSELLVGALAARGGMTLVGKEEFQAQLGQGDSGTLECISSMACLGRVGVQLDVVEVIAGTLARRADRWVFNLNRVDVREGAIVGRVFREVEGDLGAVADALNAAIPELYVPPPEPEPPVPPAPPEPDPGVLVLATSVDGADVTVDGSLIGHTADGGLRYELPAGNVDVRVTAPGYHAWQRSVRVREGQESRIAVSLEEAYEENVSPWVWITAGVAVAAFATGIGLGVASQATFDFTADQRTSGDVLRREIVAYYDARNAEAVAADLLFALGGAAAIGAFVAIFFPERHRVRGVAILPAPNGLQLRGAF